MKKLPVIDLSGQPADIGFSHGNALSEQIKQNYRLYLDMIHNNTGLSEPMILDLANRFLPNIEKAAPELLAEMEGTARGARVSLETILVLNCRSELAFPDQLALQCTVIGLAAEKTVCGRAIIAQNWDWLPAVKSNSAFFRIQPHNGPRALILAEAGQVGKIGFNEHGLGVVINLWDSDGIKQILSDHDQKPLSICRHEDSEIPQHLRMATLVSLLIDPYSRAAEVAYGQPCRTEFYRLSL